MKPRLVRALEAPSFMETRPAIAPVPALITALEALVSSTEPNVVMSSVARLSVPVFSDASEVWLSEGVGQPFRVDFPQDQDDEVADAPVSASPVDGRDQLTLSDGILTTRFDVRADTAFPAFAGAIIHRWSGRQPNDQDVLIAEFLVGCAISKLRYARLEESAQQSDDRAGQLTQESMASRAIGEATGVVMATLALSSREALGLLKMHSRKSGVGLHDAAISIAGSGALPSDVLERALQPGHGEASSGSLHQLRDLNASVDGADAVAH